MYPDGDIDKLLARGETASMDPELQDALDRLTADLRAEIRSGDAETRRHVDERFEAVQRRFEEFQVHVDERFAEMRRHFDVVAESFRGDIRSLAELMATSNERTDGRINEQAGRLDGIDGRVLGLEVRVTRLEDDRRSRRPRRQR